MTKLLSTQKDFSSVLLGEDQAIVRHFLARYVPEDIQAKIVDEYNGHIMGINELRLKREAYKMRAQAIASEARADYFVVGEYRFPGAWDFIGVFDTLDKAIAACGDKRSRFYVPVALNEAAPDERQEWPGLVYPNALGAREKLSVSQPISEEKAREKFFQELQNCADYWAELPDKTPAQRCDGLVFSILNIFDGTSMGFPSLDLVLAPHEDDVKEHIASGQEFYEPGMIINDCMLHELWSKRAYFYKLSKQV